MTPPSRSLRLRVRDLIYLFILTTLRANPSHAYLTCSPSNIVIVTSSSHPHCCPVDGKLIRWVYPQAALCGWDTDAICESNPVPHIGKMPSLMHFYGAKASVRRCVRPTCYECCLFVASPPTLYVAHARDVLSSAALRLSLPPFLPSSLPTPLPRLFSADLLCESSN